MAGHGCDERDMVTVYLRITSSTRLALQTEYFLFIAKQ